MMKIDRIHHVAYRCKDAKETVQWYGKMLNMEFVLAIAEDSVPSTGDIACVCGGRLPVTLMYDDVDVPPRSSVARAATQY